MFDKVNLQQLAHMKHIHSWIVQLYETHDIPDEQLKSLIVLDDARELFDYAVKRRKEIYGTSVFTRGLLEFTNYCKNNCYYCGLRASNSHVERYRLMPEEIYQCADEGYDLGFRTFVLQGGEDPYFTDDKICEIIRQLVRKHPDCAVTLSIGEKSRDSYQMYYDAGARRYLLRHETADDVHYRYLHPDSMSLEHRKGCLWDLKSIGYQVGSGFMVGSPGQTLDNLVSDLRFLQKLQPDMIGIGPFIPQADTPFGDQNQGDLKRTLNLLAILRLMFPYALIPSTTALGTIHPKGRELGLQAGANVVMPNLSPVKFRKLYSIYDNKICTGEESAQCRECLDRRVEGIGYHLVVDRGDVRR